MARGEEELEEGAYMFLTVKEGGRDKWCVTIPTTPHHHHQNGKSFLQSQLSDVTWCERQWWWKHIGEGWGEGVEVRERV